MITLILHLKFQRNLTLTNMQSNSKVILKFQKYNTFFILSSFPTFFSSISNDKELYMYSCF